MSAQVSKQSVIVRFQQAFAHGIESICEAARIYVEALDKHGFTRDDFAAKVPGIPASAWNGLEAVGRGILDRRLLWGGGRAASYLRRLPPSQQTAALDNGVSIVTAKGESLRVQVETMTKDQCELVFAPDHIRTVGEQRAMIEAPKRLEPVALEDCESDGPYEIRAHKLIINRPLALTVADVKRLLRQMA